MATERLLRVCEVPHDPWTFVPTDDAGTDYVLDSDLSPEARHVIEHAEPGSLTCFTCAASVGHVEIVTEDTYGNEREGLVWRSLVVVADNASPRFDTARTLCEGCAEPITGRFG